MVFSDVLKNEHFNNLAAIIRVPFHSADWRQEHVETPFWTRLEDLNKVMNQETFATNRREFINRFCAFLVELTTADPRLSYTQDDLDWFVAVMDMDNSDALAVMSMLFAWFSAPDTMLTPVEVAELSGTSESNWRNKAAAGEIPGAVKKGKQWLLPASVLRSRGVIPSIPPARDAA